MAESFYASQASNKGKIHDGFSQHTTTHSATATDLSPRQQADIKESLDELSSKEDASHTANTSAPVSALPQQAPDNSITSQDDSATTNAQGDTSNTSTTSITTGWKSKLPFTHAPEYLTSYNVMVQVRGTNEDEQYNPIIIQATQRHTLAQMRVSINARTKQLVVSNYIPPIPDWLRAPFTTTIQIGGDADTEIALHDENTLKTIMTVIHENECLPGIIECHPEPYETNPEHWISDNWVLIPPDGVPEIAESPLAASSSSPTTSDPAP
jgi:hypothetical protein